LSKGLIYCFLHISFNIGTASFSSHFYYRMTQVYGRNTFVHRMGKLNMKAQRTTLGVSFFTLFPGQADFVSPVPTYIHNYLH